MKVLPVIHHIDHETTLEQARLAHEAGADGVFLISHGGEDHVLPGLATRIKSAYPGLQVGINLLSVSPLEACTAAANLGLDMVWADNMGVDSSGLNALGEQLSRFAVDHPEIKLFASVAFKYQPAESDPPRAALKAQGAGFIATTSGDATGRAPDVFKVASMSVACAGDLAVASGLTPENIEQYAPLIEYALVATGVSRDEHHFDLDKLQSFVAAVRLAA